MSVFTADPSDLENLSAASPTSPTQLESVTAFARFEFEPGKGNDGTKVLMVEWEDEDVSRHTVGAWQVSWPGKSTQLHADDREADDLHRAYFLMGPGETVPPTITLTYEPPPASAATAKEPKRLTMTPLPAIFPPQLGESARQSGRKGVLHTIWAKKRLQALEKEIQREQEFNLEGIALEMALSERDWIETNFGVSVQQSHSVEYAMRSESLLSVSSPRTPGGSRLNEKLKGLNLGTSEKELSRNVAVNTPTHEFHPLSPESQDVAVSFFRSFDREPPNQAPSLKKAPMRAPTPQTDLYLNQKQSLRPVDYGEPLTRQKSSDSTDELFAKALSPRTPAVGNGPFSFSTVEVLPYLRTTK